MKELKNLKQQELIAKAKELGLPIKFGVKKEELIEAISSFKSKQENSQTVKETIQKEEVKTPKSEEAKSKEFIEIPDDLKHLKLTPVKKLTKEDVRINTQMNQGLKLIVPRPVAERLEREGYDLLFPLEKGKNIQNAMDRGAQVIKNTDGSTIRIDSQMSNEKGERVYHVAMKIKKELVARAKELHLKEFLEQKSRITSGDTSSIGGSKKPQDNKYMRFTHNNNNNI